MACTPVQDWAVGPPGAAQPVMTWRAWSTLALFSTSASIAASCASAPSGVCGNPDGIPTGPVLVDAGSTIAPGSRTDSVDGCASRRSDLPIGAAASASRRACTCSMAPPERDRRRPDQRRRSGRWTPSAGAGLVRRGLPSRWTGGGTGATPTAPRHGGQAQDR